MSSEQATPDGSFDERVLAAEDAFHRSMVGRKSGSGRGSFGAGGGEEKKLEGGAAAEGQPVPAVGTTATPATAAAVDAIVLDDSLQDELELGDASRNKRKPSGGSGSFRDGSGSGGGGGGGGGVVSPSTTDPSAPNAREKEKTKRYAEERRMKMEFQRGESELGHPDEELNGEGGNLARVREVSVASSVDSQPGTAPTLLYQNPDHMASAGPTLRPLTNAIRNTSIDANFSTRSAPLSQTDLLLGRDTSLATTAGTDDDGTEGDVLSSTRTDSGVLCKIRRINLLIDQCESARFPFKKKLILANMNLSSSEVPVGDICTPGLCQSMNKLSLAGNRLGHVPARLVVALSGLRTLELNQCDLRSLPDDWDLPHLKRLDLSHNQLVSFPDESILQGLPELQHLDMYGNKIKEIVIPGDSQVLIKLDHLNIGYNVLPSLPDDLNHLTALRTLKVMNNFIEKIPEQVCEMDLRVIDVSSNPLIQPPVETCERGICSMRRYYHCLKLEEKSRQRMLQEIHQKSELKKQRKERTRSKFLKKKEATLAFVGLGRKTTKSSEPDGDDSSEATVPMRSLQTPPPATVTADKRVSSAPPKIGGIARSLPASFLSSRAVKPAEATPQLRSKTVGNAMRSPEIRAATKKLSPEIPLEKKVISTEGGKVRTSPDHRDDKFAVGEGKGQQKEGLLAARLRDSGVVEGQKSPAVKSPAMMAEEVFVKREHESFMSDVSYSLGSIGSQEMMLDEVLAAELEEEQMPLKDTINDTLKVIFVGMAMTGKTSMIKRLLEGKDAEIPKREERTIGVDIYEWDPKKDCNADRTHIDTRIKIEDDLLGRGNDDVDVKFSLWDFAGQHVYHATHELFFSSRALYVLVWDMGITNADTQKRRRQSEHSQGAFKLSYDSSDDEEDDPLYDEEVRRADRALERDIDEKVQFWVDCIQSSAPGAAILPVASFDDYFDNFEGWGANEAKRRCTMMKERLLKHEERRVQGLKERLEEYERGHRANSEAALRLRKLLCTFCRPKLIFGEDGVDSVVRVSGTKYTGFDRLSEKLVNIATGRDRGGWDYPIFRGHVGARIPRMRLEVRDAVRDMRDRFKVVEWGYFISTLKERGLHSVEDVSDALHFLTNIGELSYFGDVIKDFGSDKNERKDQENKEDAMRYPDPVVEGSEGGYGSKTSAQDDEDYYDEEAVVFPMDKISTAFEHDERTASMSASFSSTSIESLSSGLSQFIFLNPRWLVAAVACILRHDLNREINETRRLCNKKELVGWDSNTLDGDNFYEAHLNCPVITAEDACMLWQAKKITKKAAERALEYSNNMAMTPFDFLQRLLIRFRVFVPIDLSIDKALLGGKEYGRCGEAIEVDEVSSVELSTMTENDARFFFLPSLLGPGEPAEVWSYKNSDSWKTTVCHSILFPDGVPPGLMERITATVLSDVYAATQPVKQGGGAPLEQGLPIVGHNNCQNHPTNDGQLFVKEILCWRSSFYLKLGMEVKDINDGEVRESVVEIFCVLVDKESHLCVASDSMGVGMRRLVLSGKGQVGEGGRKIWKGGYTLAIRAVGRVMEEYGGLEFEKQGICPDCLAKRPVSKASSWDWTLIRAAAHKGEATMRCQYGHPVDTRLITGMCQQLPTNLPLHRERSDRRVFSGDQIVPVTDMLRGVVVVGLWDGKTDKIVRVGSGFIVDKKRGLIVTASHTLMNIWGDSRSPYGENYYGLRSGKVVIGVIPRERSSDSIDSTTAVFRYCATIVAKDENIDDNGVCHIDACVLRITTKLEQDVGGDGDGCAELPEILLMNNPEAMKKERLHQLKVANGEPEKDENIRILGYNQGGEGLLRPGMHVNRVADFARGYVVRTFHNDVEKGWAKSRRFKPNEEIVVMCPTIGGHSGGPCVNQSGEVIGILSRADPTERQRCYLVPAKAWKGLVRKAKHM